MYLSYKSTLFPGSNRLLEIFQSANNVLLSLVEHDISTEEDPYNDHLNGEKWDFVFDQSHFE